MADDPVELSDRDKMVAELTQRYGYERLGLTGRKIVALVADTLDGMTGADPVADAKAHSTVETYLLTLPAPLDVADDRELDLKLLSDAELNTFITLQRKCLGEEPPTADDLIQPLAEHVPGPSEFAGIRLGRWIDEHHTDWTHRQLRGEEEAYICSGFQSMANGFIAYQVHRRIISDELRDGFAREMKAALAAIGRDDVQVILPTLQERAQIAPPEEPQINSGGLPLNHYPPFSFGGPRDGNG